MKRYLIVLFILILFNSCNSFKTNEEEVKSLFGRKIRFDKSMISMQNGKLLTENEELKKELKVVTYVASSSCTDCALKILKEWEKYMNDKPDRVGFVVVINSRDTAKINSTLSMFGFKHTVCYDFENKFIKDNRLNVKARNRTFLLDKNNEIVIVGEPVSTDGVWEVYKNAFRRM